MTRTDAAAPDRQRRPRLPGQSTVLGSWATLTRSSPHAMVGEARRCGARTASLQSTPMGQSLYASLGFRADGRYDEWVSGQAHVHA